MRLTQTVENFYTEDHSWLAHPDHHTQMNGTIDPTDAKWIAADHYPNGHIQSGIAVAYDDAANRFIPFDGAGAGAELNFAGILYNSYPVLHNGAVVAANVGVAVMVWGFVELDALPSSGAMVNGGLGADLTAARAAIAANAPSTSQVWIGN